MTLGSSSAAYAVKQPTAAATGRADRVLIVGVPGLTWSDVDRTATPELWRLAQSSAIGAMSVRAARPTTCVLDGWATLGAGNRANYPGSDQGLPPVPLPSVTLPDEPPAGAATPTDGDTATPAVDTSLGRCGLQEREPGDGLDIRALRIRREIANLHVLEHALPKGSHRRSTANRPD